MADRIRGAAAHPVLAAAVAVMLLTGLNRAGLSMATWMNVESDHTALHLHRERKTTPKAFSNGLLPIWFAASFWVPSAARPLLAAARHFTGAYPVDSPHARTGPGPVTGRARLLDPRVVTGPAVTGVLRRAELGPVRLLDDLASIWLTRLGTYDDRPTDVTSTGIAATLAEFRTDQAFTPPAGAAPPELSAAVGGRSTSLEPEHPNDPRRRRLPTPSAAAQIVPEFVPLDSLGMLAAKADAARVFQKARTAPTIGTLLATLQRVTKLLGPPWWQRIYLHHSCPSVALTNEAGRHSGSYPREKLTIDRDFTARPGSRPKEVADSYGLVGNFHSTRKSAPDG